MEHSPGPWTARPFDRARPNGEILIADRDGAAVCIGTILKQDRPLIAAAPKLLAALENLVNDFDKSVQTTDPMLVEARAAIAEAKGEK